MSELFIGREEECRRLRQDVFQVQEGAYGQCYSLIGPNGVGKTTLIRHLSDELERNPIPHTYYFSTTMEDGMTFWSFWLNLILAFAGEITEEEMLSAPSANKHTVGRILSTYRFFAENVSNIATVDFKMLAIGKLNSLFSYYTKIGVRIILTIDEFDRTREIFPDDGQFFQRLFGLTSKGASRHNLSIITISRRSVSTIAHHMQEGSNFEDAYPPLALKGFSNQELEHYFDTYSALPCGLLNAGQRQQILFLCGRSPGLLMRMRHEIELLRPGQTVDISRLYAEHGGFIRTAYERMCTLMSTEYVDQGKTQACLDIFFQQFIGPAYAEEFAGKIERLYSYGFITKPAGNENIFALSGLESEEDVVYEPLSPYFVDYVKNVILPDDTRSLSGLLEKAERLMRQTLGGLLQKHFPDTWEQVLEEDVQAKSDYLSNLRLMALQNDLGERNMQVSKLNVLSFNDYYKIIRSHWQLASPYFTLYGSLQDLRASLRWLNDCRNSSAHLNLDILNSENRQKLREECEILLRSIDSASRPPAVKPPAATPANSRDSLLGQEVRLLELEATARGGLRGKVSGSTYCAALSPAHLSSQNVSARQYAGMSITVRIVKWDDNAQKFNAELV